MKTDELKAIYHELNFWQGFVKTKRFLEGWVRNVKTPELQQSVYDFIQKGPHAKVMDVGSGVVSILNGSVPKENLVAVDPLGDLYRIVFDYEKHGIRPPVAIPAEEIEEQGFDIVHCSNALDHTQNPAEAFKNLLAATKKGGHLIIQCFENEAIYEKYEGFHRWNLTLPDLQIRIENKEGDHAFLTGDFEVVHTEKVQFESKTWFIFICKKY